jgi:hypothetical protein
VRPVAVARRMWRAARLEADLYEEVEHDRSATPQALAVVLCASVAAGIGSFHNGGFAGIGWSALAWLVGWYVWARTTWWIGTRLLPGPETDADPGELLRTLGFSSSPGVLLVLALFEPVAGAIFVLCALWMLACMIVAVRQALDYRASLRAIAVCAIGFPVYAAILVATLLLLGPWPI